MLELQREHESLLPLILSGLVDPSEENELLLEITRLELRNHSAVALGNNPDLSAIASHIREAAETPQQLEREES